MDKIFKYSLFISIFSWLAPIISNILNFKKGNRKISIALFVLFSVYFIADSINYVLSSKGIRSFAVVNFYTWLSSSIIFWIFYKLSGSSKIKLLIKLLFFIFVIIVIYETLNSNPLTELNNISYKFSIYTFFSLSFMSFFELIEDNDIINIQENFKFIIMVGFFMYFGFLLFYSLFEDLIFSSRPELQIYVFPLQHFANVMYSVIISIAIWKKKPI